MTTPTVSKIVLQTVVVARDGKRVVPTLGQAFKFTADEVKDIEGQSPDALRDPKNEDPDAAPTPAAGKAAGAGKAAEGDDPKAGAGKGKAAADDSGL